MAGYGAFQDLDLIMDHNLQRALALAPSPASNSEAEHVSVEDEAVASKEEVAAAPFGNPLSSAASISLALNSVLSSSLVLIKSNAMPQASHRGGVGPTIPGAVPSQKKSHSPVPVMRSCQVALDIPVSTPITASKKKSANYISAFPEYERLGGRVFKDPANGAGLRRASIVWFRNDLRVHDNEALVSASRGSLAILPVFCFDPRDYGNSSSGLNETGPYRAKFLIECVSSLRSSLRDRGSDLVVRIGKPEQVLVDLAKTVGAEALYVHQEVGYQELQAEEKVAVALQEKGVETNYFWGSTLFHPEDVPFKVEDMPSNYGGFRIKVQNVAVRDTIETPQQLKGLPGCGKVKAGRIPSLQELGFSPAAADLRQQESETVDGAGGEEEALKRLQKFANQTSKPSTQSETSGDSLYGANFSCKISPWLATGCLSPRRMFEELSSGGAMPALAAKASGTGSEDNGLNSRLVCELLWRDFFRFITKKHGTGKKKLSECTPATATTAA